jgi:hypothetical protein
VIKAVSYQRSAISKYLSYFEPVGRESEAHPAVSITPSLDFEPNHLRPFKIMSACSYFGQEFPAAFQPRDREKGRAA